MNRSALFLVAIMLAMSIAVSLLKVENTGGFKCTFYSGESCEETKGEAVVTGDYKRNCVNHAGGVLVPLGSVGKVKIMSHRVVFGYNTMFKQVEVTGIEFYTKSNCPIDQVLDQASLPAIAYDAVDLYSENCVTSKEPVKNDKGEGLLAMVCVGGVLPLSNVMADVYAYLL